MGNGLLENLQTSTSNHLWVQKKLDLRYIKNMWKLFSYSSHIISISSDPVLLNPRSVQCTLEEIRKILILCIVKSIVAKKILGRCVCRVDILFPSNHNIHKSSCGLCFWASNHLIDRFYQNLSIKGSEA